MSSEARDTSAGTAHLPVPPPNLITADCERITPALLPLVELDQRQIDNIVQTVPGGAANVQDIYPLSPLQEGMHFHHLLNSANDTYVLSTLFELDSNARIVALTRALQSVIDRHPILRTAVLWDDLPGPVQVVYRRATLQVAERSLDPARSAIEQVKEWMRPQGQQIHLRKAPLVRLLIAPDLHNKPCYALVQVHHLVCDHQSLRQIVDETMACVDGRESPPSASAPYRNYVAHALAHGATSDAAPFFRAKLADVTEPTAPFGLLNVHGDGSRIEEYGEMLDPQLAAHVRTQARHLGVSPARVFHAAWALVVACASGRNDVVYGTVLSPPRQQRVKIERMLGMAVNTLPLRLQLHAATATELVTQTHDQITQLLDHVHAPLTLAQRCSGLAAHEPLFTSILNYRHSAPTGDTEETHSGGIQVLARGEAWSNYPVSLTVDDKGAGFLLTAQVDQRIGPGRVLSYMQTAVHSLSDALDSAPHTPALALAVLPQSELRQIDALSCGLYADYPHKKLIHQLFAEQVARTPYTLAAVHDAQSLTYAGLNQRANQLARYLQIKGVGPGQLVGLCIGRGLDMLVGLLGILKAGAAYVPLDPEYPRERLAYLLEDASPHVVLTHEQWQGRLPDAGRSIVALDRDWDEIARHSVDNIETDECLLPTRRCAYVIYTSGSTGHPKGVMIGHESVVNLWQGLEELYRHRASPRRVALNASLNFDASVQQIVSLLSGRTLFVLLQELRRDASLLLRFLTENCIEAIDCTPSQLKSWISAGLLESEHHSMCMALVGGEPIEADLWSQLAQCRSIDFYNVYGPTECTVDATVARLNGDATAPHIGRPMANRRIHILDQRGRPTPIAVAGEIYIGGAGVGHGYLNRPELSTQRFVSDPFSADAQARLYKTGDLGRWRADGMIDYLGRNDDQVKIRGFRIELGEIETQLSRHPQVREVVVNARDDAAGEKRLVAYAVVAPEAGAAKPTADTLREYLKEALPEHMVPSAFVILERLPLTPSGKLDRRALPAPEHRDYASQQYEAPQGEIEAVLAGVWQRLLHVERVGRNDNFFELGGHSLLATRVASRVRELLRTDVPVKAVFDAPTLKKLSAFIEGQRRARAARKACVATNLAVDIRQEIDGMHDDDVLMQLAALKRQLNQAADSN
ncbi:MAG: amino acid adenylation domain-containing protein [Gammaproteobacteria bacterium]